jgi:two-component system chemotaxis response regulator CheY
MAVSASITENAMHTLTDTCHVCGQIILAGEGAGLVDAQVMHFSCFARDRRGQPRRAATSISRDMLMGVHVLIVEDGLSTREMLRAAMEYCGAFVTLASSVAEGKAIIRDIRPRVIVSDISTPNHGSELMQALRAFAIETGRKIPAVAITTARDKREHAKDAGFVAFVAKPLDAFVLALVVKIVAKGPPVQ